MNHEFLQVQDNLYKDKCGDGPGFYVKTGEVGFSVGTLEDTYKSYQLIKPYLNEPKARLLNHREDQLLVVREVVGESLQSLIGSDIDRAERSFSLFANDLMRMWDKTAQPMDENSVKRNMRTESLQTLARIEEREEYTELKDKPLRVNGVDYPPIGESVQACKSRLRVKEDTMVLGHGDEHFGNIISNACGYSIIDPRLSGFYSPSQALNTMMGINYLFFYPHKDKIEDTERLDISYEWQTSAPRRLEPIFQRLSYKVSAMGDTMLHKELLFVNLLRGLCGMVRKTELLPPDRRVCVGMAAKLLNGEMP